jgi:dipeptidyl aminopeptidase/acylaminoacyl peptidase
VLVIRDFESGTETALQPAPGLVGPPRWSPDGRTILVDGQDLRGAHGVYLVDVETGEARVAVPGVRDGQIAIGTVIWGPTGDTLWVDRNEDGLYERALDTGREEKLIDYRAEGLLELTRRPEALRLSPDRRWLALSGFLRADPDTVVLKVKPVAADQPSIELLRRTAPQRFAIAAWSPDAQELLVAMFSIAWPTPSAAPRSALRVWDGLGARKLGGLPWPRRFIPSEAARRDRSRAPACRRSRGSAPSSPGGSARRDSRGTGPPARSS